MATKKQIKPDEKIEREYTIPLRARVKKAVRYKKTPKAIKTVKEFLVKHMQIRDRDLNKIKLDRFVNEFLWARGIKNPPHQIKIKAIREKGIVSVSLVDYPTKLKFKKAREEKQEKEGLASVKDKRTMMQKMKDSGTAKPKEDNLKVTSKKETQKTEDKDKDKDGVADKKEIKEKQKSVAEAGQELQAKAAKQMKQSKGGKTKEPKRPVRQALQK